MFTQRLKEARKAARLTQRELAKLLNGTPNKVASWEQGRTEPSLQDVATLCRILDVSADYLIGLTEM